ncbi:erythromycin esterase family protein [Streptomyces abyssalis]|uniref:erythromycin esterase family protein n=1 Tax=Streptomyces abyssalis TaxID=933944 RepID=UPI001FE06D4C|nr:erythromycin esterase family protein [Streptomyces abyssalis]
MRAYNEQHPQDPVRFAESPGPEPEFTGPDSLPRIERHLAESTAWWHEHSGDRIVYWGGLAHMSVVGPRAPAQPGDAVPHSNAGGCLREWLGTEDAAIGMTFHQGTALHQYPEPPADFAESVLGAAGLDAFTLDLRVGAGVEPAVRSWLDGPVRTRLIGPVYDSAHDADHHLAADRLADLLDGVIYVREVTDARALDAPVPLRSAQPDTASEV